MEINRQRYNVIPKGINNVNVNNVTPNISKARNIAQKLCDNLNDNDSFKFYCKAAYKLSDGEIFNALELAQTGNNPARYFTWLVKRTGKL